MFHIPYNRLFIQILLSLLFPFYDCQGFLRFVTCLCYAPLRMLSIARLGTESGQPDLEGVAVARGTCFICAA